MKSLNKITSLFLLGFSFSLYGMNGTENSALKTSDSPLTIKLRYLYGEALLESSLATFRAPLALLVSWSSKLDRKEVLTQKELKPYTKNSHFSNQTKNTGSMTSLKHRQLERGLPGYFALIWNHAQKTDKK